MPELKIDAEEPAAPWEEWSEVEQLRYRLRRALEDRDILFTGRLEVMAENAGLREALEAARVERDESRRVIRNAHAAIRRHTTAAAVALAMFDTRDNAGPSLLDELAEVRGERDAMRPVFDAAVAYAKAMSDIGGYRPETDPMLDRLGALADAQRNSRELLLAAADSYTQSSNPGEKP